MKKRLLILISAFLLLVIVFVMVQSDKQQTMAKISLYTIDCRGVIYSYCNPSNPIKIGTINGYWPSLPKASMVYKEIYYYISRGNLIAVNLSSGKPTFIKRLSLDFPSGLVPNGIASNSDHYIYITASRINDDNNNTISKCYVARYDRATKVIDWIVIPRCRYDHVSVYNNRYFFTNDDTGTICYVENGILHDTSIVGRYISVSPDGNLIAYFRLGLISSSLMVYSVKTGRQNTIMRWVVGEYHPVIRWSRNSEEISVKQISDITYEDIIVADPCTDNSNVYIRRSQACDWFHLNYLLTSSSIDK